MKFALALLALFICGGVEGHDFSRSDSFFNQFSGESVAWRKWTANYYTDDAESVSDQLVANSEAVKEILEADYGIEVPLNKERARAIGYRLFDPAAPGTFVAHREDCGAATAILLGSIVAATLQEAQGRNLYMNVSQFNSGSTIEPGPYAQEATKALGDICYFGADERVPAAMKHFVARLRMSLNGNNPSFSTSTMLAHGG
ncbi:hypothetical protein ACYPKM_04090 [Pseudomonas aeruginosa]